MDRGKSQPSIEDLLSHNGLDKLPGKWVGGEAQNVGGEAYLREFVNCTEGQRIIYYVNGTSKGVMLERILTHDEGKKTISGEVLASDESASSDFEKYFVAHGMMAGTTSLNY